MKNEILKDYLVKGKVDIDKIIDDFYSYVYVIVKNGISISITDEDIEEIISDVFLAIWKNSDKLSETRIVNIKTVAIIQPELVKYKFYLSVKKIKIFRNKKWGNISKKHHSYDKMK